MCIVTEFNKIENKDIKISMDSYSIGRENPTTINYFRYDGKLYPVMNIVKIAIENNKDITNDRLYDNLSCCKKTIRRLLEHEITFYKLSDDA